MDFLRIRAEIYAKSHAFPRKASILRYFWHGRYKTKSVKKALRSHRYRPANLINAEHFRTSYLNERKRWNRGGNQYRDVDFFFAYVYWYYEGHFGQPDDDFVYLEDEANNNTIKEEIKAVFFGNNADNDNDDDAAAAAVAIDDDDDDADVGNDGADNIVGEEAAAAVEVIAIDDDDDADNIVGEQAAAEVNNAAADVNDARDVIIAHMQAQIAEFQAAAHANGTHQHFHFH